MVSAVRQNKDVPLSLRCRLIACSAAWKLMDLFVTPRQRLKGAEEKTKDRRENKGKQTEARKKKDEKLQLEVKSLPKKNVLMLNL